MAKVTAPLLSFGARGQIGKSVVFAKWRGVDYARQRVIPANPRTLAQQETRSVFRMTSQMWTLAPEAWKDVWNAFASGRPFTGRNSFMGRNIEALDGEADMSKFVFSPGAKGGLPPDAISLAGGAGTITATVTLPDTPPGWTLDAGLMVAIIDQDPSTSYTGPVLFEEETLDPTEIVISGISEAGDYRAGVFLKWTKANGDEAYSIALSDTATVTA